MTYSKQRLREVTALKRAAVKRIQSDIEELDVSTTRKYIHQFNKEFDTFHSVCEPGAILEDARSADLIWIADYHALSKSQIYAAQFVRELAVNNSNIILAV